MGVQTLRRSKRRILVRRICFGFKRLGSKIKKKTKDLVIL